MYKRSEIRYACYKAKNGVITDETKPVLDAVSGLLEIHQRWENFSKEWDVMVTKSGIVIIKPESDIAFVNETLSKAKIYDDLGKDFSSFSDRETNILHQVELLLLEGIQSWKTFNVNWVVRIDRDTNQIKVTSINAKPIQKEVTDEMIASSMKSDGSALTLAEPQQFDMQPVEESEKEMIDTLVKSSNK